MARMTQKLLKEIWSWTTKCYHEALFEIYPNELKDFIRDGITDSDMIALTLHQHNIYPRRNPLVASLYIEKVKKLDSTKLSLIIESNKKGKISRSPTTIDALMIELFERSVSLEKEDI